MSPNSPFCMRARLSQSCAMTRSSWDTELNNIWFGVGKEYNMSLVRESVVGERMSWMTEMDEMEMDE